MTKKGAFHIKNMKLYNIITVDWDSEKFPVWSLRI